MTIGFVIKNSKGLYRSNKRGFIDFIPFNKNFVFIYSREYDALNDIDEFDEKDLYTIERVISTI
jgi:hypothetical protein